MNVVNLLGTVYETPKYKNDKKVKFKVTTVRPKIGENGNEYKIHNTITCVAFGKLAKTIADAVHAGEKWFVSGQWATTVFRGMDGEKYITNELIVSMIAKPLDVEKTKISHIFFANEVK